MTVERVRQGVQAPKAEKRKRADGGEEGEGAEKKMLKVLVEPDVVKAMVAEAAENSEGTPR